MAKKKIKIKEKKKIIIQKKSAKVFGKKKQKKIKTAKATITKKKVVKIAPKKVKPKVKAEIKVKKQAKKPARKKIEKPEREKQMPAKSQEILNQEEILHPPADPLFKAKIRVIGIGGGGSSIVSEIGRSLEKTTFIIADTDIRALKKRAGMKHFWFGEEMTHGLGTGVNPELAKEAAEKEKEKIKELFKGQDIVILVASLGGGLGSGATQVFAQAAKQSGGITFGIFTLPFRFEGKNKARIAQKALKELRECLNVSITIPNERIFKVIDVNTPITDAFSVVNKNLTGSLESLIDLIYNPGVINIDFADLRTILKGSGNMAFLNTVEEYGKTRADKIVEKILNNPLYQNNNFTAEKVLFNISGGNDLSMFEVEKISRFIGDASPKAKIIFGISKNLKSKSKLKTTILMTGSGKTDLLDEPVKSAEKSEKPAVAVEKSVKKIKKQEKKIEKAEKEKVEVPSPSLGSKISISENAYAKLSVAGDTVLSKKNIRRSAVEIKRAQEIEESKKLQQEEEWEIPAFLRRVKFKS